MSQIQATELMINIKDIQGRTIFETPINENSIFRKKLMSEDYISLRFNVADPVNFEIGFYTDSLKYVFEIAKRSYPTYNTSTGGYEYELRLDAYYWKWRNKILFYDRQGNKEAAWSLTRTPDAHLSIVCSNLKALGYTYKGLEFTFSIDASVDMSAKLVIYDGTNIIDALTLIAETWDCEWWVEDHVIHLGRCEYNTALTFELAKNVQSMSRSESNDNFSTRIIAFGSERNLPVNYRDNEGIVVEGVVQKRLMLPVGTPYIDAYEDMYQEQAVEDVVIFDDVYPRRIGTMSDVTTKEYTDTIENEDGSTTKEKWNAYRFKDTDLNFSEKYVLPGKELWIVFTSGALNGMDFAVWFNPDKKDESTTEGQLWEIVRNENYGRALPDDELKPKEGDKYILYGFDTSFVSDTYLPAAEQELKQRAEEYVEKSKEDPAVYDCQMNMIDMIENDIDLNIGHRVHLINKAYFENGRDSRIYGFEKHLDGTKVTYTIGNTARYSRLAEIEGQIKEITYQGNAYSGSSGGSNIYVIGRHDNTNPTDRNVLSSTRTLHEIQQRALSRLMDDVAAGHITFDKGFTAHDFATIFKGIVKEYLSSEKFIPGFFGEGFKIYNDNGDWTAEFDNVVVRKAMTIYELIISKIRSVNGGLVISPANGRVKSVAKTTGSPVYYVLGIEGDMTFVAGDLVRCQVFTSNNLKHYWVPVKQVSGDTILCLESDFKGVVPAIGDDIVQMGNESNVNRQGVLYLTASEDGKPRIQVLGGVNSTSFEGKNKAILGCLDGITDTDFPADLQPSEYGLWAENAWLKGMFVLRSGKTVEQDAQDRVDEVQIGGRNLATGTAKFDTVNGNIRPNYSSFGTEVAETYKGNKVYKVSGNWIGARLEGVAETTVPTIISFYARVDDGGSCTFHSTSNKGKDYVFSDGGFINSATWKQYYTYLPNGAIFTSPNKHGMIEFANLTGNVYYSSIKVELGNKPTDWTPAPEDTDAAIESVRTELTTEITAIPGKIEMAVNSIQVGGRNLILDTNRIYPTNSREYTGINIPVSIFKEGETYTWSFDLKIEGEASSHNVQVYHQSWGGVSQFSTNRLGTKDWVRHNVTFVWKAATVQNPNSNIQMSFYCGYGSGVYPRVRRPKMEIGNKPTDWSPAPEDTDAAISGLDGRITSNTTSITQLSKEISLKASQTEVNSLSSRVSAAEVKITPDAINLTVKAQTQQIANASAVDASKRRTVTVDATGLDANKYYPVTINMNATVPYTITVERTLDAAYGKPAWSTHSGGFSAMCKWTSNGSGWGTIGVKRVIHAFQYSHANVIPVGSIGQMTNSSNEYIYVRGGSKYNVTVEGSSTAAITLHTSAYTVNSQTISILTSVTRPVPDIDLRPTTTEITSQFTIDTGGISLLGKKIALTGMVTFSSLASDAQGKINTAQSTADTAKGNASSAQSTANNAQTAASNAQSSANAANSGLTTLKNSLKAMAYEDKVELAKLGTTIIEGGYIKTSLINADAVVTNQLLASKIAATDITTGRLTVTNGAKLGGFSIVGDNITNESRNNSATITIYNSSVRTQAHLGFSPTYNTVALFENSRRSAAKNIGLLVSASYATENVAIEITAGCISGVCFKCIQISTNATLNHANVFVTCYNTSAINVYLPPSPELGKIIFIRRMNSNVTVHGNGKTIHKAGEISSIPVGGGLGDIAMFFYDGRYWTYNYIPRG